MAWRLRLPSSAKDAHPCRGASFLFFLLFSPPCHPSPEPIMSPKNATSHRKQRRFDNAVLRTPGQQQFAQIILRILRRIVR